MDGITEALNNLQLGLDANGAASCLDALLRALQEDALTATTEVIHNNGIQCLRSMLLAPDSTSFVLANSAKVVAEMAKHEEVREPFIDGAIVAPLCTCITSRNQEVSMQACRALGNLCCDCDKARGAVFKDGGLENLLQLFRDRLASSDQNMALWNAVCGFFMNLTYDRADIQQKAISLGAISLLVDLLRSSSLDVGLCGTAIMCIGNLAEPVETRGSFVGSGVSERLVQALREVSGDEQLEGLLEIISSLVENDDMKLDFAKMGLADRLVEIATTRSATWTSQTTPKFDEFDAVRVTLDLFVLLVTGDSSMKYIFQEGEGPILRTVMDNWISSHIEYFRISAALAIGNFARNDENCIMLVNQGIIPQLLRLLKPFDNKEPDTRLTHAVLSALRNLAIPKVNKPIILSGNTLEEILPFLKSDMLFVQFKLLGTARMLVDGMAETAVELGLRSEFVERVVELCGCEVHPGVCGEATRLLASLIKHSGSTKVMENIVQHQGLPRLVGMATSEHPLMQNEALVALTLIASSHLESAESALLDSRIISTIKEILQEDMYPMEVKCNVLTLAGFLTLSGALKQAMVDQKLPETIENLKSCDAEPLRAKAATIISHHFT